MMQVQELNASQILFFALFLIALWSFRVLFDLVNSGLIGQIIVGVLFVAWPKDALFPGAEGLGGIGLVGVSLLVFSGGLTISLERLKQVGLRAFFVALLGAALSMGAGIGILVAMKFKVIEAVAGGAALASTSIGMALTLMNQQKIATTALGALITTAAMIDDVISLLLLAIVAALPSSSTTAPSPASPTAPLSFDPISNSATPVASKSLLAWSILRPIVASTGTLLIGIVMIFIIPRFVRKAEAFLKTSKKVDPQTVDRALIAAMLGLCYACAVSAEWAGASRLLGCFVAGLAFADLRHCQDLWDTHVAATLDWLVAIFFASIGFFFPVSVLFQGKLVGYGFILAVAAALGKFLTILLVTPKKHGLAVGVAMIARGELGLLICRSALAANIMSSEAFVVVVWAIILCTFFPPFPFGKIVAWIKPELADADEELEELAPN